MPRPLKIDPTRTSMLRRQFAADMQRRFKSVSKAVFQLLVEEDAFGWVTKETTNARFRFLLDDQKLEAFNLWLVEQINTKVLNVDRELERRPWVAPYIESAYRKGIIRGYTAIRGTEKFTKSPLHYAGGQEAFVRSAFSQPERVSKIRLLSTRTFESLKGITADMGAKLNRVLADGMAQGKGARTIARSIAKEVEGITRKRAMVLARTEIVHAHAEGQLDSLEDLGVEDVVVMAEWQTAGDDRVCPQCAALQGRVFTIAEARGMLPLHPQCRCAWVPVVVEKGKKKRVRRVTTRNARGIPKSVYYEEWRLAI